MKTPQQKKRESYEFDRRNAHGENSKASRKGIRHRKRLKNRNYRRAVNSIAARADVLEDADHAVKLVRRGEWKKTPDIPLGQWVKRQEDRRDERNGKRKVRRKECRERGVPMIPEGHEHLPHVNTCSIVSANIRRYLRKK